MTNSVICSWNNHQLHHILEHQSPTFDYQINDNDNDVHDENTVLFLRLEYYSYFRISLKDIVRNKFLTLLARNHRCHNSIGVPYELVNAKKMEPHGNCWIDTCVAIHFDRYQIIIWCYICDCVAKINLCVPGILIQNYNCMMIWNSDRMYCS